MERFWDLRRTHKKAWYGAWALVAVAVVAAAQWHLSGGDTILTQVLGASVKSTPAPTITSGPSGPTASTTATFAYSDSEKGVTFQCARDGASLATCPAGSVTYTDLAQGPHTFRVIAVGVTNSPATTRDWSVDTGPPAQPGVSSGPENPTIDTSATFAFAGEVGATFECQIDADRAEACTSPWNKKKISVGDHAFRVVAIDAAGNRSAPSGSWTWTVLINKAFGISGDAVGQLYPGMAPAPLNLKISNPYNFALRIVTIDVAVFPSGACGAANLVIRNMTATHGTPIIVPANSTAMLADLRPTTPAWPADWPAIAMNNGAGNQDVCKTRTFTLSYTGTATKS